MTAVTRRLYSDPPVAGQTVEDCCEQAMRIARELRTMANKLETCGESEFGNGWVRGTRGAAAQIEMLVNEWRGEQ